ncbi:MAG: hypothetical protein IPM56_03940 [Ignavibacteriales bacterium]|nr:MAG: hypothetical protein IPM56_03940 [Ignavibacteriales bacterium]
MLKTFKLLSSNFLVQHPHLFRGKAVRFEGVNLTALCVIFWRGAMLKTIFYSGYNYPTIMPYIVLNDYRKNKLKV